MSAKAYLLLRTVNGHSQRMTQLIEGQKCVAAVDSIEGAHDVVVILEAADREKLARAVVNVLASVETITEAMELLPVQNRRVEQPNIIRR